MRRHRSFNESGAIHVAQDSHGGQKMKNRKRIDAAAVAIATCGSLSFATGASAQLPSTRVQTSTMTIAVIGDSFSSGEGAGDYYPDSGACHRSPNAWALQLSKYVTDYDITLPSQQYFIACSGADSTSLYQTFKSQEPQLYALDTVPLKPRLVLMTMGGNDPDLGFSSVLRDCYLLQCAKAIARVKAELPAEEDILATAYGHLSQVVPSATILIIGYPLFFTYGTHDWCNGIFPVSGFSPAEQTDLDNLIIEVDDGIQKTVEESGLPSMDYVPTTEALRGHTLCTSKPWIVDTGAWKTLTDSQQQAHPNALGQEAIAKIVAAYIDSYL
jgi:lysophospholipase L1-like esterase